VGKRHEKKISIIAGLLAGAALFIAGFFARQPVINKLQNQVKELQKETERLNQLRDAQHRELGELLIKYKAMGALQFKKKSVEKENIKGLLIYQYGAKEYLGLLINSVKHGIEMPKEAIGFFNAFDKVIDGEKVSYSDRKKLKEYIFIKHRKDIDGLVECDDVDLIKELEAFWAFSFVLWKIEVRIYWIVSNSKGYMQSL
jgi:hypothetical protein